MRIKYVPRNGGTTYEFEFSWVDGWRVYIIRQPPYGRLASDAHTTHRLSANGRHFICWTSRIATIDDAKVVAASWAEGTERYRRTGDAKAAFSHPLYNTFNQDDAATRAFARLQENQS